MLGPILAPLEPHRQQLVIVEGIDDATNALDSYNAHTTCRLHKLTAQGMVWKPSGDGVSPVGAGGISIDQLIAERWADLTPYRSLEFGVSAHQGNTQIHNWLAAEQPLPPENNPEVMFDRLFADFQNADPEEVERRKQNRLLVLDAVKGNFDHVRARVSAEDKLVLDAHVEAVHTLEKVITNAVPCEAPDPPTLTSNGSETAAAQIELLTRALSCDMTRVATLALGEFESFPWLNLSFGSGWHDAVHAGPTSPSNRTKLIQSFEWYIEQLALLLSSLENTPDGEGTLLDSTLVLLSNDFSNGAAHSHIGKTYLLAGGAAGGFAGERLFDATGRTHGDLFTTVLNILGMEDECFGNPEFCSGAIGGLA